MDFPGEFLLLVKRSDEFFGSGKAYGCSIRNSTDFLILHKRIVASEKKSVLVSGFVTQCGLSRLQALFFVDLAQLNFIKRELFSIIRNFLIRNENISKIKH